MKKVILAKHTGKNDDNRLRYWNYNDQTNHWWNAETSKYAIVDTEYGYQLVEIIGTAKIRDDIEVEQDVVTFVSNDDLAKEVDLVE